MAVEGRHRREQPTQELQARMPARQVLQTTIEFEWQDSIQEVCEDQQGNAAVTDCANRAADKADGHPHPARHSGIGAKAMAGVESEIDRRNPESAADERQHHGKDAEIARRHRPSIDRTCVVDGLGSLDACAFHLRRSIRSWVGLQKG